MQRKSYSSKVVFGIALCLAIALPALGQQTPPAPVEQVPAPASPAVKSPDAMPAVSAPGDVETVVPAPVKVANRVEPVVSLGNTMVSPGFSFDEARQAPIFGTPAYFQRILGRHEMRVELQPTRGYEDYVVEKTLRLTLPAYLDLVLANNTGIALQKVLLETPKNAIQRSMAFLDPTINGNFRATRSSTPATSQLEGAGVVSTLNQPTSLNYQQTFIPGTQVSVGTNANRTSSNNQFLNFNPGLNTAFQIDVTQPLLRDRGIAVNRLPILIARNAFKTNQFQFENQVIQLLSQAETAYWDFLEARENLRVQEAALSLRRASLQRAQRELELGAIPELDVFQPQADFAQAEVNYTQARFRLARTEDVLRQQMGIDLHPVFRTLPIEFTDVIAPPTRAEEIDREAMVELALRSRPDLLQQRQQLVGDEFSIRQTSNSLRPNLSLNLRYSGAGRGGDQLDRVTGLVNRSVGLWSAYGDTLAFDFPTYSFAIQLQLPLRDRRAAADYADSMVRKKSTMLRVRDLEQTARLDVLNAINNLEASRESVRLASIAREFAQKRLDAEQKKYDLGTITLFFLQSAQTDLITADQRLVTERINYNRNRLNMLRLTGTLLTERGVVLAVRGSPSASADRSRAFLGNRRE
ncbi:MAG: TolC family protein [Bryobacterales bacterium]|nr:TolC family protein [Bryobacterales bacterium]